MSHGYSAVCAMVRDEPDLREWVAYHLAIGFQHVYLYDNESRVPVSVVLRDFVAAGKVSTYLVRGKKQQVITVFPDVLRRAESRFRWVAFIDADEFILPHDTDDINVFLADYEKHPGLGINWQIFGDSGYLKRPSGLIIENYLRRGRDGFPENNQIKCIVSPKEALWAQNPHSFNMRTNNGLVDPNGNPIPVNAKYCQAFNYPPVVAQIQINHYYIRSAEDFQRKVKQGGGAGIQRNERDFENIKRCCNEVRDERILRFAARTKELMGEIGPSNIRIGFPKTVLKSGMRIFRILAPPPHRSPKAIETHAGLLVRDLPPVAAKGNTVRDREIAASLAHAGVMRAFLDSDAEYAVVLEDDAILASNREWMSFTDYDLFLPYVHNREHRPPDTHIRDGALPQFGAFAYLCSREFAVRYLPRLLAGEVVDHAMPRAAQGLRKASFAGNLVNHDNECVSSISEERRKVFLGQRDTGARTSKEWPTNRRSNNGMFDPKAKVVTGIVSCQARTLHRQAIRATFLESLPCPVFIVGTPDSETLLKGDTLMLKCDDTYEALPQKMWAFYEWLLRTSDFEYVLKMDDDCLVHLQSLYAFLFKLYASENRPDYLGGGINRPIAGNGPRRDWHIGKVADPRKNVRYEGVFGYPFCKGGYGYFLSRKAVKAIVEEGREMFFDTKEIYEDKLHGDVLCPRGMMPHQIGTPVVTTDLKPDQFSQLHLMHNGSVVASAQGAASVKGATKDRTAIQRDSISPTAPVLCFDVGGTQIKWAVLSRSGDVVESGSIPSLGKLNHTLPQYMIELAKPRMGAIGAVVVCICGGVDNGLYTGYLRKAGLSSDFAGDSTDALGVPVFVEWDCACWGAGLALAFDAHFDKKRALALAFGTGVAAATIDGDGQFSPFELSGVPQSVTQELFAEAGDVGVPSTGIHGLFSMAALKQMEVDGLPPKAIGELLAARWALLIQKLIGHEDPAGWVVLIGGGLVHHVDEAALRARVACPVHITKDAAVPMRGAMHVFGLLKLPETMIEKPVASLSVVTLWRGPWSPVNEALLAWMQKEVFPVGTQFVWVAPAGSEAEKKLEDAWGAFESQERNYTCSLTGTGVVPAFGSRVEKHQIVAALYNEALSNVADSDAVIFIEDDVIPKHGAIGALRAALQRQSQAGAIMAAYPRRSNQNEVCAMGLNRKYIPWPNDHDCRVLEVDWIGGGLVIYRGTALRQAGELFATGHGSLLTAGWDVNLCRTLKRNGYRSFVDLGNRAEHRCL